MNKIITLNLPEEWITKLDNIANHGNRTRSQLIRAVLKKQFELPDNKVVIGRPKTKEEILP